MLPHSNKTIAFPKNRDQRFEEIVQLFETGYENDKELLKEFISLLDEGCEEANFYIGCIYETGEKGIEKDLEKAIFYYSKGIENVGDVESYLALARIYFYGIDGHENFEQSYEYYSLVERESKNGIASFMLGKFFLNGTFVEKDFNKAEELFMNAAGKGYVYGLRNLANLEKLKGNKFKSMYLTLKSAILAIKIAIKDPSDVRLRAG